MPLKERQQSILDAVIRNYIRTARPVASNDILGELSIGVSPATVRNEMSELDELGYLEQPHTSAGRVPTDKGYRFFVDHLISDFGLERRMRERVSRIFDTKSEDEFVREFSRTLSELSGGFSAAGVFEGDVFYGSGLSRALQEPEFDDAEHVRTFGRLIDSLDESIHALLDDWESEEERVFIGEENPLEDARFSSMVVSRWQHPKGYGGFIAMVGPRRMDYPKIISLAKFLNDD